MKGGGEVMPYKDPVKKRGKAKEYNRKSHLKHKDVRRERMKARQKVSRHHQERKRLNSNRMKKTKYYATANFINYVKSHTPCADCNKYFPHYVIDFHHTRGNRVDSVTGLAPRGIVKVLEEMDKCVILCKNCHAVRTFLNRRVK